MLACSSRDLADWFSRLFYLPGRMPAKPGKDACAPENFFPASPCGFVYPTSALPLAIGL